MIQTINTENDLRSMLTEVIGYLGWAFHPDDSMTDYVYRDTGEPSYTPEEAKRLDLLMDEAFEFCKQQRALWRHLRRKRGCIAMT